MSEQTNETASTTRKPRKGSKAAIDAAMAANAQAVEETAALAPSFSADLADATADAPPEWEWDTSEEALQITLTPEDKARLLDENGVDQKAKDALDSEIDQHKDAIKSLKAQADVILARTEGRNRAASTGIETRTEHWKVGTCFALNTVRYLDPVTDRVVHERAVTADERQVPLPLVVVEADDSESDPTEATDPEALLRAAQAGEDDPADRPLDNDGSSDDLGDEDES